MVWQADTRSMNPGVPQSYIDKHIAEDAARASAEYGAQFRSDIEGFVAREVVDAATFGATRRALSADDFIGNCSPFVGATPDSPRALRCSNFVARLRIVAR